jgi:hypothetical protein
LRRWRIEIGRKLELKNKDLIFRQSFCLSTLKSYENVNFQPCSYVCRLEVFDYAKSEFNVAYTFDFLTKFQECNDHSHLNDILPQSDAV